MCCDTILLNMYVCTCDILSFTPRSFFGLVKSVIDNEPRDDSVSSSNIGEAFRVCSPYNSLYKLFGWYVMMLIIYSLFLNCLSPNAPYVVSFRLHVYL